MEHVKIVDRDLGWAELFKRAAEIKDARAKVGVLADDKRGGQKEEGGNLTVAEVGAIMEFGDTGGHIPGRSFVRATFDERREKLADLGKELIEKVLTGKVTVNQALNIMGADLATSMKKRITEGEGIPPPNAPSTIARKGSSRPLVDTGRLVNAITWAIEKKGEEEHE